MRAPRDNEPTDQPFFLFMLWKMEMDRWVVFIRQGSKVEVPVSTWQLSILLQTQNAVGAIKWANKCLLIYNCWLERQAAGVGCQVLYPGQTCQPNKEMDRVMFSPSSFLLCK